jgi:hypothetical protein
MWRKESKLSSEIRSLKTFEHYRDASQRFDYLVTGAVGALCAYIAQTYIPQKLGLNSNTLELVSLLVLVASAVAGFKRIEYTITLHKLNFRFLDRGEVRGHLIANTNGETFINIHSGDIITPEYASQLISKVDKELPEIDKNIKKYGILSSRAYKVRNYALLIGFLLLLLSRVLKPYM